MEGASTFHPSSIAKVTLAEHKKKTVEFEIIWCTSFDVSKYKLHFSVPKFIEFSKEVPGQNAYAYFYPPSNVLR